MDVDTSADPEIQRLPHTAAMEVEEPDACRVIQSALSCINSIELVNDEMQCMSAMSRVISSTFDRGGAALFTHIRDVPSKSMPELIKDDYIYWRRFVLLWTWAVRKKRTSKNFVIFMRSLWSPS